MKKSFFESEDLLLEDSETDSLLGGEIDSLLGGEADEGNVLVQRPKKKKLCFWNEKSFFLRSDGFSVKAYG